MSNNGNNKTVVIFDGISGVAIGKEVTEAFNSLGYNTVYVDNQTLKRKWFYKARSSILKAVHKTVLSEDFFYYPKLNRYRALTEFRETTPDIILVIGFIYKFLDPKSVLKLKKELNAKLVLWDTDSCNLISKKREFDYFVHTEFPLYDKIFSFSKKIAHFINDIALGNASYLPFGAKPIPHIGKSHPKYDICFVGSADMRRIFCLEQLKEHNLVVYGSKWARNKSLISEGLKEKIFFNSIWGKDLLELLVQSKIVLNITRSTFYGIETGLNLRVFEALAARRFFLTDYCDELNDLFVIGEEIETYKSTEELIDKVDYYLAHDKERERIAQKGYEIYLKKYKWQARIEEMLSILEKAA